MKWTKDILDLEENLKKLDNLHASFDYFRITVASPKRMKSWAERFLPNGYPVGKVTIPETINFRTHLPEVGGLFCERIFGPTKDYKCRCGQYTGFVIEGICEYCWVELVEARVRRYRMGYITLAGPVTHLWYLKGVPNYFAILLRCFGKIPPSELERIIYYKEDESYLRKSHPLGRFVCVDQKLENRSENELAAFYNKRLSINWSKGLFPEQRWGAELIHRALESLNVAEEVKKARSFVSLITMRQITGTSDVLDKSLARRIRILESFLSTETNPSWMVLTTLPVLPPSLRPLVELESGCLVAADLNELYRIILTRNHRFWHLVYELKAPDIVTVQTRKLLQEGVDSLIDNSRVPKERQLTLNSKPLKSLTEILEGKQGRFRQSLLGKRVDYSGRSVIVVGPSLRLNQCGLPYEMGIELFQPFLLNELLKTKMKPASQNMKLAQILLKKNKPFVWRLLIGLIKKHAILLNRAPTLHRFGIQAFDPVIILGQAIHLHPLVCAGFNADFDGDQMAVHLPLYEASQLEVRTMMRPSFNVLSPANGEVILKPSQDMVIGCYYLTLMVTANRFCLQKWFSNEEQALGAFYQKKLEIHTSILVRYSLSQFQVEVKNNRLKFLSTEVALPFLEKEIIVYKTFFSGFSSFSKTTTENLENVKNKRKEGEEKFYLITNLGILRGNSVGQQRYILTDVFLETTAGRLLFSINLKNSLKTEKYGY